MRLFDPDDTGWVVAGVLIGAALHIILTKKIGIVPATGITTAASAGGYLAGWKFEQVNLLSPISLGAGIGQSGNLVQMLINYLLEEKTE